MIFLIKVKKITQMMRIKGKEMTTEKKMKMKE
jgi:hypothetical protein